MSNQHTLVYCDDKFPIAVFKNINPIPRVGEILKLADAYMNFSLVDYRVASVEYVCLKDDVGGGNHYYGVDRIFIRVERIIVDIELS